MRTVLGFLALAAVLIGAAWGLSGLPGTVSATIGDTVLEASTPVALLLLFLLVGLLYLVSLLLGWLLRSPGRTRRWQGRRQRRQGDAAVTRTLLALAAGDSAGARRGADLSRRLLGDKPMTLLLAAQAARQAGRDGEAEAVYRALAARDDAAFLGLRGLLRQATAREDWTTAAELARQAERVQPGAAWLRGERAQLAIRGGEWRDALRLSGPDAPRAALITAAAQAERDPAEARRLAKQAWEADPALVPAALTYARTLRAANKTRALADVLRRSWAATPHPDLAAFALDKIIDKLTRVQAAQALVAGVPDAADSHLLLGRVSLDAGLTGEAKRHAEAARDAGMAQRRLALLFADVAEAEGDREAARDALRRAATLPDPVWQCGACGTVHEAWHPVCTACGTAGRIAWSLPAGVKPPEAEPEHAVLPPAVSGPAAGSVAGPEQREVARLPNAQDAEPLR